MKKAIKLSLLVCLILLASTLILASCNIIPTTNNQQNFTEGTTILDDPSNSPSYPTTPSSQLEYRINDDGSTCTIIGIGACTDKDIVIPSSIDGYKVTAIGYNAFAGNDKLLSVNIPVGVTSIGEQAFMDCINIGRVVLPDGLISIDSAAFWGCYYIAEITIPNSVVTINNYAFKGCVNLSRITFEKDSRLTTIGIDAFFNCDKLTNIIIPGNVTSIGWGAFYGCNHLESMTLPVSGAEVEGKIKFQHLFEKYSLFFGSYYLQDTAIPTTLTTLEIATNNDREIKVESNSFWDCKSLTNVTFGAGVTSIKSGAFANCDNLSQITISEDIKSIGSNAFSGCRNITTVILPDSVVDIGESAFSGCNIIMFRGPVEGLPSNKEALTTVVLTGSGSIQDKALSGYTNLTSVTLSNEITSIGNYAFEGCSGLTSIIIPDSVTSIGEGAFSGCSILTSITIPDSVTSIGAWAFYDCDGLTSVTIGNSVTSIGYLAFSGCDGLTSVTIGNSVTSIGYLAFSGCYKLIEVINKSPLDITVGSQEDYGDIAYYAIEVHNGASKIVKENDYLFYTYNGVNYLFGYTGTNTVLSLPENYNGQNYEIYKYAFYDCGNLTSIAIPDSVTSIGGYAFFACSGLTSIKIPDSVTSIGKGAFYNCNSLESITIPFVGETKGGTDNTHFGYIFGAYSPNNNSNSIPESLKTIIITGGTSIGDDAFRDCSSLTSITIPDSVTSIGEGTFYNCSGLTSIKIPDGVTSIGEYAFGGCSSLTSVTIGNGVTSIGEDVFYDCTGLTSIMVSDGNTVYEAKGNCLIEKATKTLVAGCKNSVIPTDGSVTSIGLGAFVGCSGLTSITIPDSVTSICDYAFSACTSLTSITISDSVTSMGVWAFNYCVSLTSITFEGTIEQWNTITYDTAWNNDTPATEVICSDGVIKLN